MTARIRVLVVDDVRLVLTSLRRMLQHAGFEVEVAESGGAALVVLESAAIDVVVSDFMMPGMNGKELADRVAANRPDTKMIFMSGRAAEVISEAGVLIPVDAFLAKPFTVERLLNKVRERLEYRSPFSRPR